MLVNQTCRRGQKAQTTARRRRQGNRFNGAMAWLQGGGVSENSEKRTLASEKAGVAGIAGRYATALFELAEAGKDLDQLGRVESDLVRLRAILAESTDFQRFVTSPVLSREEQIKGMAAIGRAAELSPLVQRFLGVVAANRRLFILSAMIKVFLARLAGHRGEITAEITAARPLSEAQQAALSAALAAGGNVRVAVTIDPMILGGLVVKVGPRMVDSSLRTKLHRLKIAIKGI